ncbi:CAAX protease self-immunity [Saccharicrinis carchari]|uniref:CAAX protease self-immunity n=1 Tax=Saccharicrinis carchari TaxID=1168039 RepID=A0A521AQP7_SACCC|nr:type II CAAX endopeptidase family protein [Saccharicrinis carchari]SMO37096.1 CAAX protease self-immunity [Saccharicrinis carchari]
MSSQEKKEIILFSTIAIGLSSLICYISFETNNPNLSILSVFTPSLLALAFTAITKGRKGVHDLFVKQTIKRTSIKWLLLSLIGIPLVGFLAMLTSLNFAISMLSLRTYELMPQIVIIILIALGEEYGWRGFLLPRLMNKFNLFYSSIILGLIWGLWHFPAYLIGTGIPLQMNFMVFLLWVILGTLFISWIYYYTRSVLTSILAHISANAAFNYLLILPEFTGSMNTFWIFIFYLSIIIMIVFYVRRKDLIKGYSNVYKQ